MRLALTGLAVLLASAITCSFRGPAIPLLEELHRPAPTQDQSLRWPPPPGDPRIVHLGAISADSGFEGRRTLWSRVLAAFTGDPRRRFVRPAGICLQGSRLAVADPGAAVVHLLDMRHRRWQVLDRTAEGPLGSPVGVAFLPDGRLVASDSLYNALWLYDVEGAPLGRFAAVDLQRPTGLLFDQRESRLWVAETAGHRLRAFDAEGREVNRIGERGAEPGLFNFPAWLAAPPDGGLWVTDSLNFRLQRFDETGRFDREFGIAGDRPGEFARPRGLAVDAEGRLFAVDALFDSVQIFDASGRLLMVFGGRGTEPGRFWLPADVALDASGHVFVTDSYNQRVQIFSYHPPEEP
jgi:sugar lactone lactonase YvrE